jgi:hypothetical protein
MASLRRAACGVLAVLACAAHAQVPDGPWTLRHPAVDPVPFRGVVDYDQAGGGAGGMAYPAPNFIGFLAAIATHAVINEGVRSAQMQKLQAAADASLVPLQDAMRLGHGELLQLALAQMPGSGAAAFGPPDPGADGWQVSVAPAFSMTRDLRGLMLDNAIGIYAPGQVDKPVYAVTVRVVARPRQDQDPVAGWRTGEQLKQESARMLAHSLQLALRDAARPANADAPFHTLRYLQGTTERVERVQQLEAGCQRQVARTLRGWLLSAPLARVEAAEGCDPADFASK